MDSAASGRPRSPNPPACGTGGTGLIASSPRPSPRQKTDFSMLRVGIRVSLRMKDQAGHFLREIWGQVAFMGETHFAAGNWVGVMLDEKEGKNDGKIRDIRYFVCQPGHGIFVRPELLKPESPTSEAPKAAKAPIPAAAASGSQAAPAAPLGKSAPRPRTTSKTKVPPDAAQPVQESAGGAAELPGELRHDAQKSHYSNDARALHKQLVEASENHDITSLNKLLPKAESLGVVPCEIQAAKRILEYENDSARGSEASASRGRLQSGRGSWCQTDQARPERRAIRAMMTQSVEDPIVVDREEAFARETCDQSLRTESLRAARDALGISAIGEFSGSPRDHWSTEAETLLIGMASLLSRQDSRFRFLEARVQELEGGAGMLAEAGADQPVLREERLPAPPAPAASSAAREEFSPSLAAASCSAPPTALRQSSDISPATSAGGAEEGPVMARLSSVVSTMRSIEQRVWEHEASLHALTRAAPPDRREAEARFDWLEASCRDLWTCLYGNMDGQACREMSLEPCVPHGGAAGGHAVDGSGDVDVGAEMSEGRIRPGEVSPVLATATSECHGDASDRDEQDVLDASGRRIDPGEALVASYGQLRRSFEAQCGKDGYADVARLEHVFSDLGFVVEDAAMLRKVIDTNDVGRVSFEDFTAAFQKLP